VTTRREALRLLSASALNVAAARPNILFVISDDLNNDFGGLRNLTAVRTPNLDRLTARGVRFESWSAEISPGRQLAVA
jgi:arylsulfatase A-like enzyme